MRRKRLLWQLYPSYLLITAVSLIAVSWYSYNSLTRYFNEQLVANLQAEAELVHELIRPNLVAGDFAGVDRLVKQAGKGSGTYINVLSRDGRVIADSRESLSDYENQISHPEVSAALRGAIGTELREHAPSGERMQFVAVPVSVEGEVVAAVRVARPTSAQNSATEGLFVRLGLASLVIIVFAAIVSLIVSKQITRPLRELKQTAELIARGDLESRIPPYEYEEVAGLADSMNRMAQQLDERFRTVQLQRLEQETIVSSMIEGVVAMDTRQRVLSMNRAAARLLNLNPPEVIGRDVVEIIRNTDLQRFITQTLNATEPLEADITLVVDRDERSVQVHGTLLRNPDGEMFGALIVLNDITRLRKLENVRRDFVANVSHELKTPITSIKGFVETLLDADTMSADESRRFLEIIARQANRLHAIIEDLLKLSRIEQGIDRGEIELEVRELRPVLSAAIHACENQAAAKEMEIRLECDPGLRGRINAPLLEQAIVNLVDNAVKYGFNGKSITVSAESQDDLVVIAVADEGPGIDPEHLPRLFERFYRVDRARSSSQGGTGLGLAIVKHITISHGGTIDVQSEVGGGTVFTLKLARR